MVGFVATATIVSGLVGVDRSRSIAAEVKPPVGSLDEFRDSLGEDGVAASIDVSSFTDWVTDESGATAEGFQFPIALPGEREVTLAWHGDSPLRDVVMKEGATRRIEVNFLERKNSIEDLESARDRLITDRGLLQQRTGFILTGVGSMSDEFDGLSVTGVFADAESIDSYNQVVSNFTTSKAQLDTLATVGPAEREQYQDVLGAYENAFIAKNDALIKLEERITPASDAIISDLETQLDKLVDVPIAFDAQEVHVEQYSRNDYSYNQFFGGALMKGYFSPAVPEEDRDFYCSTGFALRFGSAIRAITADHCKEQYTPWLVPSTHAVLGAIDSYSPGYYAARLNRTSPGRVFDGAYNAQNQSRGVEGHFSVLVNNQVCTSGAMTGTHCGIEVDDLQFVEPISGRLFIRAHSLSGGISSGAGDSGGPIVVPGTVAGKIRAVGMIQQGNTGAVANCGPRYKPYRCGNRTLFTSIKSISDVWGAPLVIN